MLFLDWPINFFGRLTSLMDGPVGEEEGEDGAVSGVGAEEDQEAVVIALFLSSCRVSALQSYEDLAAPLAT